MPEEYDFFKMMHGKSLDQIAAEIPSADATIDRAMKQLKSRYPLRLLGRSKDGDVYVSEEERYLNFHILGAPGEGKSKFLEYHIRQDIKAGRGLCLIDPSEKGDTARAVLDYCAQINHQKVILIDPTLISEYKKIPCIAPLSSKRLKQSVNGLMESLSILFESKSTSTPRIRRYLSALLRTLAKRGMTIKEARYFSDYHTGRNKLDELGFDYDVQALKAVFRTYQSFENHFFSSINRIDAFWQEPLASILSNTEGIDFMRVIADEWVVLVNLSPYRLTEEEAELLGVVILSQIIQATDTLVNNNWNGIFYLYIDEVGRFATPQIENLLSYKRKSGLRMYLAHHHFKQFEGKEKVLSSIENNARIKLMFDTPGYDDRMRMIKALGYGGDIPPLLAAYANQNIPKQNAVLRKNKETPVRIRIPDVPVTPPAPKEYIESILSRSFYKDARSLRTNTESPQSGKVDDAAPDRQAPVPRPVQRKSEKGIRQDHQKPAEPPPKRPIKI